MAQQTLQRPIERAAVAPFPARRLADRDDSRIRPVLTFRRSTWSVYVESQMSGSGWVARRR